MSDLSWTTQWDSVIVYDNQLLPNTYTLTVDFDINTDSGEEQNISFDRIKHFVDKTLHDAIFCSINDDNVDFYMTNFKQKLVTFVQQPQDLIVVSTLYAKFNAIVDGKITIDKLQLSSRAGGDVRINFDSDFAEDGSVLKDHELIKLAEQDPWWFRNDCGSADYFRVGDVDKQVTFITDVTTWEDTGLEWPEEEKKSKKDASNWSPTIIPGGKTQH